MNLARLTFLFSIFTFLSFGANASQFSCKDLYASDVQLVSHELKQLESDNTHAKWHNDSFWTGTHSPFFSKETTLKALGISKDNPKWVALQFPGEINKTEYANLYVENTTLGVGLFAEAFEANVLGTLAKFKEVLQNQNRLSILGSNPDNPYGGYFMGSTWRNEFAQLHRMARILEEPLDFTEEEFIQHEIKNFKEDAGSFRTYHQGLDMDNFLFGLNKSKKPLYIKYLDELIVIPEISREASPENEFEKDYSNHKYPGPEYFPEYLTRMQKLMLKIRNCENCSRIEILELLSDYYHTGINTHLFRRVNQSLLMAQVNYILLRMGLVGISHISLPPLSMKVDAAAITMSANKFKNFFIREVIEKQNSEPLN